MTSPDNFGKKVEGEKLLSLRRLVVNLAYSEEVSTSPNPPLTKFPGTAPVGLCKRDFAFMRQRKYWVCEKSDGTRVMLLSRDDGIYLIDTQFNFYLIPFNLMYLPSGQDSKTPQQNTLIDGEMVHSHHYNKPCFMIFDIVAVDNVRLIEKLEMRLNRIRKDIIEPWRTVYNENDSNLPFVPLGKDFFPLNHLDKILMRITHFKDKIGHRYVYQNGKRYNENDGLIFTPDDYEYKPGRSSVTKRWKWPELNTVQFLVKTLAENRNGRPKRTPTFKLFLWSHNRHVEYRTIFFHNECTERLMKDLDGSNEAIIECFYDANETNDWKYHRIRAEKEHAFLQQTAMQQLEIITDNITVDILKKNLVTVSSLLSPSSSSTPRPNTTPTIKTTPVKEHSLEEDISPEHQEDVIFGTPVTHGKETPTPERITLKRQLEEAEMEELPAKRLKTGDSSSPK